MSVIDPDSPDFEDYPYEPGDGELATFWLLVTDADLDPVPATLTNEGDPRP